MGMHTQGNGSKVWLPVFDSPIVSRPEEGDVDVEAELKAWEDAERERLGIRQERRQWADGMLKPNMTKSEKARVTLLISGLTAAQDFLVEGALKGLGYNVHYFGVADGAGLQAGKEFGNRGQCNPCLLYTSDAADE